MAKKCSGCGADLPENVKFCIKCGLNLQQSVERESTQHPSPDNTLDKVKSVNTCPSCKKEIPGGTAFCIYCGSKLDAPQKCPGCGADLPENVKFCIKCGLNLQGVTSQSLRPAPKTATSGSTGENKVNDQCPVCHKEVSNNAPYCIHCGSKLGDPIRTNIAGPAGISKDSEKDRVNIADIIGKPSVSPVQQSGNNDLLSKINASKKEIAEAKKLLTAPTNPKVITVQKEQKVQSNEKKKNSGPSLGVIMAAGLLIIIALVVWASVGHDNKKAISDKVSPQVSQQAFVYDEEAIENFMREYFLKWVSAVNNGKFEIVSKYLEEGTPLYNEQKQLVSKLFKNNVKEQLIFYDISSEEHKNSNEVVVTTYQKHLISYPSTKKSDKFIDTFFEYRIPMKNPTRIASVSAIKVPFKLTGAKKIVTDDCVFMIMVIDDYNKYTSTRDVTRGEIVAMTDRTGSGENVMVKHPKYGFGWIEQKYLSKIEKSVSPATKTQTAQSQNAASASGSVTQQEQKTTSSVPSASPPQKAENKIQLTGEKIMFPYERHKSAYIPVIFYDNERPQDKRYGNKAMIYPGEYVYTTNETKTITYLCYLAKHETLGFVWINENPNKWKNYTHEPYRLTFELPDVEVYKERKFLKENISCRTYGLDRVGIRSSIAAGDYVLMTSKNEIVWHDRLGFVRIAPNTWEELAGSR